MSQRLKYLRRLLDHRHGLRTTVYFGGPHTLCWSGQLRLQADRLTLLETQAERSTYFLTAVLDPKSRQLLWGAFCRRCQKGVANACPLCPNCHTPPERAALDTAPLRVTPQVSAKHRLSTVCGPERWKAGHYVPTFPRRRSTVTRPAIGSTL